MGHQLQLLTFSSSAGCVSGYEKDFVMYQRVPSLWCIISRMLSGHREQQPQPVSGIKQEFSVDVPLSVGINPKELPCSRVVTGADLPDGNIWWAWIIYTPKHLNTEGSLCIMSRFFLGYFKYILMLIFSLWGRAGLGSWRGASSHSWALPSSKALNP